MSGRVYRLRKKRNPVNYFTYEDYEMLCQDITNVNRPEAKKVVVTHSKNANSRVASFVSQILQKNGIKVVKWSKYASSNKKTDFTFEDKEKAIKAMDIIARMSTPDSIDPAQIKTDGSVTSKYGVKLKVDVEKDNAGNTVATTGGNYVSAAAAAAQPTASSGSSSMTKWIIIGGIALVAVVALLVILRKKKVI